MINLGRLALVVALFAMVCAPITIYAQEKGATKLLKLDTVQSLKAVQPGDTVVMTCPKCQDSYAAVVDKSFKGAKPEELKTSQIHLCPTCETKIVTKGEGKAAKDTLVHTCKMCGSQDVSCYLMKKGGA